MGKRGGDTEGEGWRLGVGSLFVTCKMSDVNPMDYMARTLRAILDGHPWSRTEFLMP